MNQQLTELSCKQFSEILGSKASVPGGGGAAALIGSLAAALGQMAANYTTGKKKYAEFEEDIQRILKDIEVLRRELLDLVQADADAFEPLSKAYSKDKNDPDYAEVMEKATLNACAAPMEIMKKCCLLIPLLEELCEKGSRLMISDVGCGALSAGAALESAALNVLVNTRLLRGNPTAEEYTAEVKNMLAQFSDRAGQVAAKVQNYLLER